MTYLDKLRHWLCRKAFNLTTKIDYSIRAGDTVTSPNWSLTALQVVDINWALSAVAVKLGPNGGIVVWPIWSVKKILNFCKGAAMPRFTKLSRDHYLAALLRIRKLIKDGRPLAYGYDDTPGDKSSSVSWGLCACDAEAWPDAEDHDWPEQFLSIGRVSPKELPAGCNCPLEGRPEKDQWSHGCFYKCKVFNPAKGQKIPVREQVIILYTDKINKIAKPVG